MPERQITVSICLPTLNGAAFLRESLESALAQTHENLEILIGDDGSTDDTFDIAESYARNDNRIELWRNNERKGLFANYNECANRATGRYLKLLAQDDILEPSCVEKLLAAALANPSASLIGCKKNLLTEGDLSQKNIDYFTRSGLYEGIELSRTILTGFENLIGEPSTVLLRRNADGSPPLFDTKFHHLGDTDLWIEVLQVGDYYRVDETLSTFRQHSQAATARNVKGLLIAGDLFYLGEKHQNLLTSSGISLMQYKRNSIQCLVSLLRALQEKGLSWDEIKSINEKSGTQEQISMLELIYQSLLYASELESRLLSNAATIDTLNNHLSGVLTSDSWKLTQPLREARQLMSGILGNNASRNGQQD